MRKTLATLSLCAALVLAGCQSQLASFPSVGDPYAITSGPGDHLLANYFGINAWSPDNRYVGVLEVGFNGRLAERTDTAVVALVDLNDNNKLIPISKTVCWNFQEAAMFHWLPDGTCLFNDL